MAPSNLALELERIGIDPGQYPLATGAQTVGSAPQLALGTQALGTPTPISAPPPAGPTTAQRIGGAVGAIGDVLQNTAAGFYGRGMTTSQIQAQQQLAGQTQLQNLSAKLGLVSQVGQMIDQVPEEQREELRARMIEQIGPHAPEFVDLLSTSASSGIASDLAELAEYSPEIRAAFAVTRDPKARAKFIMDNPKIVRRAALNKLVDPTREALSAGIDEFRVRYPEKYEEIAEDGITPSEGRGMLYMLSGGARGTRGRLERLWDVVDEFPEKFEDLGIVPQSEIEEERIAAARARGREKVEQQYGGQSVNVAFPDGKGGFTSRILREVSGRFYDTNTGERVFLPEGARKYGTSVTGTKEDVGLTTAAKGETEKRLISNTELLSILNRIEESFKPEFLTWAGKGKIAIYSLFRKAGIDISPQAQKELGEATTFKQFAYWNINSLIRQITGAQMNKDEAGRIRKQTPDPELDSDLEFETKLHNQIRVIRLAASRDQLVLKGYLTKDARSAMKLANTRDLLFSVADEMKNDLVNSGVSEESANQMVRQQIYDEFGVDLVETANIPTGVIEYVDGD